MHEDYVKFLEICEILKKTGVTGDQIAKMVGLAPNYVYTLLKDGAPEKAFRASTLAKMQDFNKKYALNELHWEGVETEEGDKTETAEKPTKKGKTPIEERGYTFGEHLDQALHLCPPGYEFEITLKKIP